MLKVYWLCLFRVARASFIVINKDMISLENINIFIGETQPTG